MKPTLLASLLSLASLASFAEPAETNAPRSATLEAAVAASGWTVEELVSALDLLEAKYNREVRTDSGRRAWHGKKTLEIVDTNALTKVSVFEDGTRFTDAFKITRASDPSSVRAANAKLPGPLMTNGIPVRLAKARKRQRENANTVSNVTVTVSPGR